MPCDATPRIVRGAIVKRRKLRADRCDGDRLAGGNVRCGRRNRQRSAGADVDLRDVQPVGVRMLLRAVAIRR